MKIGGLKMEGKFDNEVREASGNVTDSRLLVSFLYLLGRDSLSLGRIEDLVDKASVKGIEDEKTECSFTNGWLALWAKNVADRLGGEICSNDSKQSCENG
jgi:hypothetical protein